MRNLCLRLLLSHSRRQSEPHIFQVHQVRSFASTFLHHRAPHALTSIRRLCASPELDVEPSKPLSDPGVNLVDYFGKDGKSNVEIKQDLDAKNVFIDHDVILSLLRNANTSPDVAKRIFDWALENHSQKLSSKSYNLMLGILGSNGFVTETWDLIESMKKKGYGVSKGTYDKIFERFQNDGLSEDIEKLKDLYASGSASCKKSSETVENKTEDKIVRISEMILSEVWGDDLERRLRGLGVKFTGDLVVAVLKGLEMDPNKALIFFRWVQESDLFKHNQQTYDVMARVLGKEDHGKKFWRIVDEMRSRGYEMEGHTYLNISLQFVKNRMLKEAVDLYEFAMFGENKPTARHCTLLLKKVVVSKELDMDLFSKVVSIFKANGNELTDSHLKSIIKSLISVGRMPECNKILAAMKEAGYEPSVPLKSKIAFLLGNGGTTEAVHEFTDNAVSSLDGLNYMTWTSLVKGYCARNDLDGACNSIREMVAKEGGSRAGHALDLVVNSDFGKKNPLDAFKFVVEMVNDKGLRPWCATYKALTSQLLRKKHFNEALDVMNLMKNHGFAPDLDSFVEYLSRTGSAEDAVTFSLSMTSKRHPSKSVFIRLFEAYFKAGRQKVAQDFLSRCPRYIKNHADILNLFSLQKSGSNRTPSSAAV
ncbi:pentatricopeptide repeat-containing protein At3g02490, mitochondrial-like [Andrographis paniculata]|uniref:pentatricopeptide repeat-containing protein At3g02490, mitochondrial-like n=1 Tax=Andrographis paniculata TaxID=175694 RepID=UPI0021E758AC|nr:pentatricopeptide repeat-containing protein At3g02490, mitochondrial-like [Andrographis paniculata]